MRLLDMYPMVQSEGHQYGAVQFMVRAAGCAVKCPIRELCDEVDALDFTAGTEYSPEDILYEARRHIGHHSWIHISGGEPCNQPQALIELQQLAHRLHYKVHLQTSGTIKVPIKWDWLTVSPKCSEPELQQRFGQELKLIHTPDVGLNDLAAFYHKTKFSDYYLQPLWDDDKCNADETLALVTHANKCGMQWKMSVQWHKWFGFK